MHSFPVTRILLVVLLPIVALFFLNTASATSIPQLPLDHFIKHGDYLDLKLSPDGEHLAGRLRKDGTVLLFVMDTHTQEIVGGVKPPANSEIHTVTWANNKRLVFEFAQRFSYIFDQPVATGELFGVDIDGSNADLLYGFRAGDNETGRRLHTKSDIRASQEIISLLEHDDDHILIAEYPWVAKPIPTVSRLNIYTGRKKKVERIPFPNANILADKHGNIRFVSWYDKANKLHAASRQSAKSEWSEISIDQSANQTGTPVQINDAATKVYWRVDLGSAELASLQELDLETGVFTTLFSSDQVDLEFWESDLVTNEPAVGVFYTHTTKYQYADTESSLRKVHQQLAKAFTGQNIFITSHTADGQKLLLRVTSDVNPGEFYIFDQQTKKVDFLWANLSWIDPRQMAPMQNISFTARDGQQIDGLLTLPVTNKKAERPPLIVIPHGGPHGVRDHWNFDQEVQLLANRGYAVLQVNFRGSGGYGKAFEKLGYRQWGGAMIEDIIDATKWVIESAPVSKDQVCIYGASYGGYAAMMAASKAPSLYRCAVGYVGVYDLNIMYSDGDIPRFWGGEAYLEKVLGRNEQQLNDYSPTRHVDKITAELMIIHGTEDRRAPIKHANYLRQALKAVDKDFTWLKYGDSGHGVWDIDKRRDLYSKLLKFLADNLRSD